MRVHILSYELGVEDKVIRQFLRSQYGSQGRGGRWNLTDEQVTRVRGHFSSATARPLRRGRTNPIASTMHDQARQLRLQPQDIIVPVEGGPSLVFHQVIFTSLSKRRKSPNHVTALLSNGAFLSSSEPGSPPDFVIEKHFRMIKVSRGFNEPPVYQAIHEDFVERLLKMKIPQRLVGILMGSMAGRNDTPQELVIGSRMSKRILIRLGHL